MSLVSDDEFISIINSKFHNASFIGLIYLYIYIYIFFLEENKMQTQKGPNNQLQYNLEQI